MMGSKHLIVQDTPLAQARYRFARDYAVTWVEASVLIDTILRLRYQ